MRVLSKDTILVFVFDTDTDNIDVLRKNINKANKASNIKAVRLITQVKNIEDELVRSTNIKRIEELLNSRSKTDFKRDFIRERHLKQKLEAKGFDIGLLWCKEPTGVFVGIKNDAVVLKCCK